MQCNVKMNKQGLNAKMDARDRCKSEAKLLVIMVTSSCLGHSLVFLLLVTIKVNKPAAMLVLYDSQFNSRAANVHIILQTKPEKFRC